MPQKSLRWIRRLNVLSVLSAVVTLLAADLFMFMGFCVGWLAFVVAVILTLRLLFSTPKQPATNELTSRIGLASLALVQLILLAGLTFLGFMLLSRLRMMSIQTITVANLKGINSIVQEYARDSRTSGTKSLISG
jgi:hypothetical protein